MKKCKNDAALCGGPAFERSPGNWTCGACRREERDYFRRRMTPEQLAYDEWAESQPKVWHGDREPGGCSCHINPPCSYCCPHD